MSEMIQDRAEVMAKQPGFAGGINIRDAPSALEEDEAIAIANVILDERGGASKRQGSTAVSALGAAATRTLAMYTFYRGTLDPQVIVHLSDGTLRYSTNFDAGTPTWTQIASGKSTTVPYTFETYLSKCYMGNGVNSYASWDGTTFVEFASAPKGKYIRLWKDAIWISGVTGLEHRVYTSDVADPENFSASGWVDIFKGDGDRIMGLAHDSNTLIVAKLRRLFFVFDPATFANRVIDNEKGAESHNSFIVDESGIYYLTSQGVAAYTGDGPSVIVSDKIDPLFARQLLNFAAMEWACAYRHGSRIGWTVPEGGSSVPNLQLEYYPHLPKKPFTFHRMPARVMTNVLKGGTEYLLYGHNANNKVLKAGIGPDDDGTMFQGLIEVGWYDFNAPLNWKYLRLIKVVGRGSFEIQLRRNWSTGIYKSFLLDLSAGVDLWSTGDAWNQGAWGPDSLIKEKNLHPDAYGRLFLIRIIDSRTGTGSRPIDVANVQKSLSEGEWALLELSFSAQVLGDNR